MQPETLFDDVEDFIQEGRRMLQEGALMELGGLEERVRTLCESVMQMSQEQRAQYADRMSALLADLTTFGNQLVAQRDAISAEMRQVSQHKKAHVAYRTVHGDGGLKENEEE